MTSNSQDYFRREQGGNRQDVCHFPLGSIPSLRLLRSILQYLPIIGVVVVIGIVLRDCTTGLRWGHERIRISTIALVTFALGPGCWSDAYMKSFIGRPRPANTFLFGGDQPSLPPESGPGLAFVIARSFRAKPPAWPGSSACFRFGRTVTGTDRYFRWRLLLLQQPDCGSPSVDITFLMLFSEH